MAISNTEILKELGRGNIGINPLPPLTSFNACNVDLSLGHELIVWPMDVEYVIDYREEHIAEAWKRHGIKIDLREVGHYVLRPGELCLALTKEHITLPTHSQLNLFQRRFGRKNVFLGHLSNRSCAGRSFIRSAVDAFEIKPGTNNRITLEIVGEMDIALYEGLPFIQISFEQVHGQIFETNGWVHGQQTPSGGESPKTVQFAAKVLGLHARAEKKSAVR